jgi:hypothetical protein
MPGRGAAKTTMREMIGQAARRVLFVDLTRSSFHRARVRLPPVPGVG